MVAEALIHTTSAIGIDHAPQPRSGTITNQWDGHARVASGVSVESPARRR